MGAATATDTAMRPARRPPIWLRALFGLLGLATVLFNAALMLSDRAPSVLRRVFGDAVVRLSERIDAAGRIQAEQLPETDAIVHIAAWAAATVLVGLTIWTWRGLVVGALTVLAVSVVVELGQGVYSSTRTVEVDDVVANAAGVAVGTVLAALAYLAWSALAAVLRPAGAGSDGSNPRRTEHRRTLTDS